MTNSVALPRISRGDPRSRRVLAAEVAGELLDRVSLGTHDPIDHVADGYQSDE